ncbi:LysR family transcriptional regulator [Burkholderia latens]|uniref:LysR family transcriptional regulator n=1 Tax=Burkholderia latens TaxID=488446 RepID=A0A6H9TEI7_9BURK|nr:LysR family transcriptional regulator [Burkholderia latens]KAB0633701.1 LysR family transcriptional regulator [Burkholderia latens]
MMNLLEAMRIFGAVVEQASARPDGPERCFGCRLLRGRPGGGAACADAGVAFHACWRRTLSALAHATGATEPGACATIYDSPVAGFPLPGTIRRRDRASFAAPTTLHRPSR